MDIKEVIKKLTENKGFKIVFYGDSITSAEWIHPNYREIVEYVLKEEVSKKTGYYENGYWYLRCINSGFSGASTKDLVDWIDTHVFSYKPDFVLLMATSNDVFSDIDPKKHVDNLMLIVDKLSAAGIKTAYSTDLPTSNPDYDKRYLPFVNEVNKTLKPHLESKKIPYICLFEEFKAYGREKYTDLDKSQKDLSEFFNLVSKTGNSDAGIKTGEYDFIHPNVLGNAIIAKIILKIVFNIEFDHEKYLKDVSNNMMDPGY